MMHSVCIWCTMVIAAHSTRLICAADTPYLVDNYIHMRKNCTIIVKTRDVSSVSYLLWTVRFIGSCVAKSRALGQTVAQLIIFMIAISALFPASCSYRS